MTSTLPLPTLFSRALVTVSKAANLPTVEDETQELIHSAVTDLKELDRRVAALSLFSSNEVLEDISTRNLVYLFARYVLAEVQNRVKTTDRDERMTVLKETQVHLRSFIHDLDTYCLVPEVERVLYAQSASSIKDAAKRREFKIKQFKAEKDLRARIEVVRKRRKQTPIGDLSQTDFDLIRSLLPSTVAPKVSDEDEDDLETDEILREAVLLLLRLNYAQAYSQLESMNQEFELLRSAPPPPRPGPPSDDRKNKMKEQDDMWKLDTKSRIGESGPLLDSSGKPLRPFTILPAGASDRARLQAQVFGPGHRLPTMSIDEYLKIEQERGNILTGGGPQSEEQPTSSEQLAIDSEVDGTVFGETKSEEKRQKDEQWAQFKDVNPRGAGNTMNRG
ncbi:TAP42-like protein [Suillus clintonianus]|uniref:TAP42-like protein n=1 Tax=Suillus clintonianus TaxID=1904413 RepID=UPI001B85C8C1|nr:TAP42-like protein [Suillus clintonianus]KAG2116401.1 TAP42-like protein [Suillus clintonianus]